MIDNQQWGETSKVDNLKFQLKKQSEMFSEMKKELQHTKKINSRQCQDLQKIELENQALKFSKFKIRELETELKINKQVGGLYKMRNSSFGSNDFKDVKMKLPRNKNQRFGSIGGSKPSIQIKTKYEPKFGSTMQQHEEDDAPDYNFIKNKTSDNRSTNYNSLQQRNNSVMDTLNPNQKMVLASCNSKVSDQMYLKKQMKQLNQKMRIKM